MEAYVAAACKLRCESFCSTGKPLLVISSDARRDKRSPPPIQRRDSRAAQVATVSLPPKKTSTQTRTRGVFRPWATARAFRQSRGRCAWLGHAPMNRELQRSATAQTIDQNGFVRGERLKLHDSTRQRNLTAAEPSPNCRHDVLCRCVLPSHQHQRGN